MVRKNSRNDEERYDEKYRDDGWVKVLDITKDTTDEEIEAGLRRAADIMTPPVEHPMWEALTKSRYLTMDPADRAFMYANDEEEAIILECARKRMENGETEGEAFHNLIMEGIPGVVLVGRAEWEDEVEEEYREPTYSVFAEGDDSLFGALLIQAGYSEEERKKIYNGEGTLDRDGTEDEETGRSSSSPSQARDDDDECSDEDLSSLLDMVFEAGSDGMLLGDSSKTAGEDSLESYEDLFPRFTQMEEGEDPTGVLGCSQQPQEDEDASDEQTEIVSFYDPARVDDPNSSHAMFERLSADGRHADFDGDYLHQLMSGRRHSIYAYTVADRAYIGNTRAWWHSPKYPSIDIREAIEFYDTPDVFWMVARCFAIGAIYVPRREPMRLDAASESSSHEELCEALATGRAIGRVIGELYPGNSSEDNIDSLCDDIERATVLDADDPVWGYLDYIAIVIVNEPQEKYAARWEEMGLPVYQMLNEREKCLLVLDEDADEFDRQLSEYVAGGGDDGVFCHACQWRAETLGLDVVCDWIRNNRMAEETRRFAAEEGWEA